MYQEDRRDIASAAHNPYREPFGERADRAVKQYTPVSVTYDDHGTTGSAMWWHGVGEQVYFLRAYLPGDNRD